MMYRDSAIISVTGKRLDTSLCSQMPVTSVLLFNTTPKVTCAHFKTAKAVFLAGSSEAVIHLKRQKRSGKRKWKSHDFTKRKRKRKGKQKTSQAKRLIKRFSCFAGHLTAVICQL